LERHGEGHLLDVVGYVATDHWKDGGGHRLGEWRKDSGGVNKCGVITKNIVVTQIRR
jgi:hypothetical protein